MNRNIITKMSFHFLTRGDQLSADLLKFALARMVLEVGNFTKNFELAMENENSSIYKNIVRREKEGLTLYGAGDIGGMMLRALRRKGVEVTAVIDTYKTGTLQGVPIITLAEYKKKYPTLPVVITPLLFQREIAQILRENGVSFLDIDPSEITRIAPMPESIALHQRSGEVQYMSLAEMPWRNGEVFVDCGVYDGGTTLDFIKKCQDMGCTYHKIFGFEPDPQSFSIASENLSDVPGVTLFNQGISDHNGDAKLVMDGTCSVISTYGTESITLTTLDEALRGERVTFIKMDIEGVELAALKGASEIIRSQKPKLAICIYHKAEDIWEIPEFLWGLNPDYQFYLRLYSDSWSEMVLYAIPTEHSL